MNTNSGGYNAYFFVDNLSALQKARMPNYSKDLGDIDLQSELPESQGGVRLSKTTVSGVDKKMLTNLLNKGQNQRDATMTATQQFGRKQQLSSQTMQRYNGLKHLKEQRNFLELD